METESLQLDSRAKKVIHDLVLELNGISEAEMLDCRNDLKDADEVIGGELSSIVDSNSIGARSEEQVEGFGSHQSLLGKNGGNLINQFIREITEAVCIVDILRQGLNAESHEILCTRVDAIKEVAL